MAAILGQGIGTLFAAVAFSGSSLLFKHLDSDGYEAERERHDHALEELAKAKEEFYEEEVKQHNKIQELRQELSDANADINETNKALSALKKVQYQGRSYRKEPKLSDFYEPSNEMKKYSTAFVGIAGIGSGYLIHLLL